MTPEAIQQLVAQGPWVTLVTLLILVVFGLWKYAEKMREEVIAGLKREAAMVERLMPLIEVLKDAIQSLKRG